MALTDRSYMRRDTTGPNWSLTVILLVVNVLVFFAEYSNGYRSQAAFLEYGALSLDGLKRGFVWQLLTFQFLHGGIMHLVFNCLVLYFFGRPLEIMLGKAATAWLYFLSGMAGGVSQVLYALLLPHGGGPVVGASAGICGLVAAYALLDPESRIYLFFFLPLKARYVLPLMIVVPVVFMFTGADSHIAHAAHLGGTLLGAAMIYFGWHDRLLQLRFDFFRRRPRGPIVKVRFPRSPSWRNKNESARPRDDEEFITREVDPILDKMLAHGPESLTERERRILEAARHKLDKR